MSATDTGLQRDQRAPSPETRALVIGLLEHPDAPEWQPRDEDAP